MSDPRLQERHACIECVRADPWTSPLLPVSIYGAEEHGGHFEGELKVVCPTHGEQAHWSMLRDFCWCEK